MLPIGANQLTTTNGTEIFIDFAPQSWDQFMGLVHNLSAELHFLTPQEANFAVDRYVRIALSLLLFSTNY